MAERHRSHDGTQETRTYRDDQPTPSQSDRSQGGLERDVGTRDEEKRARKDEPGVTRVQGRDKEDRG